MRRADNNRGEGDKRRAADTWTGPTAAADVSAAAAKLPSDRPHTEKMHIWDKDFKKKQQKNNVSNLRIEEATASEKAILLQQ